MKRRGRRTRAILVATAFLAQGTLMPPARGYVLNRTIAASGGCPQLSRHRADAGRIDRRWSTVLESPIRTVASDATGRQSEVRDSIERSFAVWTSVAGSALRPSSLASLQSTSARNACNNLDGINSICFSQSGGFSTGVLAFTRTMTSDRVGESLGGKTSSFIGEILDSDIRFRPDGQFTFATPGALSGSHFDLESVLIHELGHFLGFNHSGIWRAMMYPFAPNRGTFTGDRPTMDKPDGPLADDERAGLRVLYPDPNDTAFVGAIRGFVLPANPLALADLPSPSPGRTVTGIFGAQVVAVDAETGAVMASVFAGWSCNANEPPTRFDGFYELAGLPVGKSYKLYAEPLDGPVDSGNISVFLGDLCRNDVPTPCTVPTVFTRFSTRSRLQP